jgi:hypothetical protein
MYFARSVKGQSMEDRMSEHKNIYSALCAAQQEFGQVTKGSTNPAFKSKYADLADVANVVIPTLSNHGVAVLHYMAGDDLSAMRTEFVHAASETRVHCDVPLIVDRQNMQGMKSATTYAKRIGLESLSGIAPEDDDGNAASKSPPSAKPQPKPAAPQYINADQFIALRDLVEGSGADEAKFLAAYGAQSLEQFPLNRYADAVTALNRKIEKERAAAQPAADLGGDGIPY